MRMADCHLDRKHYSRGLCRICYQRDYRREWYALNVEKERQRQRDKYLKYKDRILEKAKKQRTLNPSYRREYEQNWRENNRERYLELTRDWLRRRKASDPVYKLHCRLRSGLYDCLSGRKKNRHTAEYLGCSIEELRTYLEAQFSPGMSWDNYGKWHIDHIRPLHSFDFGSPAGKGLERRLHEAWNFSNLRPLWASENIAKGSKWIETK